MCNLIIFGIPNGVKSYERVQVIQQVPLDSGQTPKWSTGWCKGREGDARLSTLLPVNREGSSSISYEIFLVDPTCSE
jgi:hypothetical protein